MTPDKNELGSYPSHTQAWYGVVILTLAYVLSFLDRQLLSLVVTDIKTDLELTDSQMSIILGFAFALFYTTMGIPIGRLADKKSRKTIIGIGISVWCLMTAATGIIKTYLQLFIARVGVGVGEATLSPSALSIISDYFPKEKRGTAMGFFNMGVSVGSGIALILGGQIVAYFADFPPIILPIVGQIYEWQVLFICIGIPGLLVALLMTTIKEPSRKGKMKILTKSGDTSEEISIKETIRFIYERKEAYGWLFLSMACSVLMGYAFLSWLPTMYMRAYDVSISTITLWLGVAFLVGGPLGATMGGWLGDKLYTKYNNSSHVMLFAYSMIVLTVAATLVPLMPSYQTATLMFMPQIIMAAGQTALAPVAMINITPNQIRGQVTAVYFFIISLTGYTLGPTSVALITDFVFKDESLITYSISIVSLVVGLIGTYAGFKSLNYFRKQPTIVDSN
ncbi:MAG TPA: MFS transporter [Gammaproteobacteria bacterium]|jgi:MFS family permease|nr:MFS transporter [Gammaproteobacteria bacterium]HIK77387.1 MFS transporter [Gammaproteobacteria bacterium]